MIGRNKSINYFREKRQLELKINQDTAQTILNNISLTRDLSKLICALLYWCEGSKQNLVKFTTSDPNLAKTFLKHLRMGFDVDEDKFRALMHLHQYHNEATQKELWHKVTGIPTSQFNKTYWKANTSKNIHLGYPGCLAITYLNAKIAKEILAIYTEFAKVF